MLEFFLVLTNLSSEVSLLLKRMRSSFIGNDGLQRTCEAGNVFVPTIIPNGFTLIMINVGNM